jgi:hypothetical protein
MKKPRTSKQFPPEREALLRELWPTATPIEEIYLQMQKLPGIKHFPIANIAGRAHALGLSRPPGYKSVLTTKQRLTNGSNKYIGSACKNCGNTVRYKASFDCIVCCARRSRECLEANPLARERYNETKRLKAKILRNQIQASQMENPPASV